MTIVLTGDSITDASRDRDDAASLGHGYAALVADALPGERVLNTGISGNRVVDLQERWDEDVLAHAPSTVSIMIGINDTWRRFDSADTTDVADFEAGYRELLVRTRTAGVRRILLLEPFLLPVREDQWAWREDLDPKLQVVRRLATEPGVELVATDGPLAQAAGSAPERLADDGVHPTPAGHRILADLWLARYHRA